MGRVLLIASLALLTAGCRTGNTGAGAASNSQGSATAAPDPRHELTELMRQYRRALAEGDTAAAGRFWADDLIFVNHRGEVVTKAQRMENLRSGATAVRYLDVRDQTMRVFGDAAVATSQVTIEGQYGGRESSGSYRSLIVWAKPQGRWQIVAVQTTLIADAAETQPATAPAGAER